MKKRCRLIESNISQTRWNLYNYRINTDTDPVTYYFDLLLRNQFLHGDNRFFSSISRTGIFVVSALAVEFYSSSLYVAGKEKRERNALAIIIACGGMIGMALNLLLY